MARAVADRFILLKDLGFFSLSDDETMLWKLFIERPHVKLHLSNLDFREHKGDNRLWPWKDDPNLSISVIQ